MVDFKDEEQWPGQQIKEIEEADESGKFLTQKYKHIFLNSEMGREVLIDILLTHCHLGQYLEYNQAQIAEHNLGVAILIQCGVFSGDNIFNSLNGLFNSIIGDQVIYRKQEPVVKKRPRGRPKGTKKIKKEEVK